MSFRLSKQMPEQSRDIQTPLEAKRKYFFVVEGEITETIYIREIEKRMRHTNLAEVLILERLQGSHSNQYKITVQIDNYLSSSLEVTAEEQSELDIALTKFDEEKISEAELIERVKTTLKENGDIFLEKYNEFIVEQIRALSELLDYERDYDRICLILDRDYRSFKSKQYDDVLKICEENNFSLGLSNPNFEFYLYLHLVESVESLDKDKLKLNRRITKSKSSKKYSEWLLNIEMKKHDKSFRKNKYDAKYLISRFDNVIKNSKYFSESNKELKDTVGTSAHLIFKELIEI